MNMTLYRKYRPNNFDSIYGQAHVVKTLKNEVVNNLIVNSYIFSGQKGSGKTSIAKIFSKAINCLDPINGNPCNKCKNCELINNQQTLDFLELDAASNNGVDQIRNLINACDYQPNDLKYKIFIIDEAHMLTTSAWNALLKTIEEPKNKIVFIFATTEYHKIPDTIISRSQRFDFFKINNHDLMNLIIDVSNKENIKVSNDAINTIINLSQGSARDCLTILDQLSSISNKNIDKNVVNQLFGLVDIDNEISLLSNIINQKYDSIIATINNFDNDGVNFYLLYSNLINDLLDAYIFKKTNNKILLTRLNEFQANSINSDEFKLLELINYLTDNLAKLKNSDYPKWTFEFLILNITENFNKQHCQNITKNIQNNIEIKKQETIDQNTSFDNHNELSLNKLPDLKKVFKTKDRNIQKNNINEHLTNNIERNQINLESNSDLNEQTFQLEILNKYRNDVFSIACNKDNQIRDNLNLKLKALIDDNYSSLSPQINSFLNAKKFIISSPNGSLVQMNNLVVCERFNKNNSSPDFINFYKDNFGLNQKVIALDKSTIELLLNEYKTNKPKNLNDVKLNFHSTNDEKEDLISKILDIGNKIDND